VGVAGRGNLILSKFCVASLYIICHCRLSEVRTVIRSMYSMINGFFCCELFCINYLVILYFSCGSVVPVSALSVIITSQWLPYRQNGTVDDEATVP